MTPITTFAGRTVAVFGLGGSGMITAGALIAGGATVVAWDDNATKVVEAHTKGIPTTDLEAHDWTGLDALVLSPGVPLTHPEPHWVVKLARAAGVAVIGDIELFCRERAARAPRAPFIAITGTNGKSTTTALIAHILRDAGRDVQMGGNIGTAILSLDPPAEGRCHVIECSSFQIDLAPSLNPSAGVLLNITPDHLDRHGTMANYAGIKERLVMGADKAIVSVDDDWSEAVALRRQVQRGQLIRISLASQREASVYAEAGRLISTFDRARLPVVDLSGIGSLRGVHNAQNAAAATAVALLMGIDDAAIQAALRSFPGLAHRMEQVGHLDRILFVNDSKATNADSAAKALASFDSNIFWIVGGRAKQGGIESLAPFFPRIAKAYLVGESSPAFAATLDGHVPCEPCGTIDVAVERAAADARAVGAREPVVLLSPACASYDQFPDFEVRGNRFRDLVLALPGLEPISRN